MTDNYQIGRMICLVSYVLLGLTVIVFSVVNGVDNLEAAVLTAVTWLAGFVILHVTNGPEHRIRRRFCILNSLFTTIFEMQLCVLFRTPHILFMMFLVQWIATVFFLDRVLCTYMLFIDLTIGGTVVDPDFVFYELYDGGVYRCHHRTHFGLLDLRMDDSNRGASTPDPLGAGAESERLFKGFGGQV